MQKLVNFILTAVFWVGLMALMYYFIGFEPPGLMTAIPRASPYPTATTFVE